MDRRMKQRADELFNDRRYREALEIYSDLAADDVDGEIAYKIAICCQKGLENDKRAAYWFKVANDFGYEPPKSPSYSSSQLKELQRKTDEIFDFHMSYGHWDHESNRECLKAYRILSQDGSAKNLYRYAYFLEHASYYAEDCETLKILDLLKESADQGYAPAQHQLGECYVRGGNGVFMDREKARYYLTKAADQGYAPALYSAGVFYHRGLYGEIVDEDKARYYLTKAADKGDKRAIRYLKQYFHIYY